MMDASSKQWVSFEIDRNFDLEGLGRHPEELERVAQSARMHLHQDPYQASSWVIKQLSQCRYDEWSYHEVDDTMNLQSRA